MFDPGESVPVAMPGTFKKTSNSIDGMSMKRFLDTWDINNRINVLLLDSFTDENFRKALSANRASILLEQFVHMHNTRLLWLEENEPSLASGLVRLKDRGLEKEMLKEALDKTADAIKDLIRKTMREGKVRNFRTPYEFLVFMISHEAQCRNKIVMTSIAMQN
jgi:uncharacterized damage-inducible protein DinB